MKYETMQNLVDVYNAIETLRANGYLNDEEHYAKISMFANTCAGRMALLCNRKKAADETVQALQQKQNTADPNNLEIADAVYQGSQYVDATSQLSIPGQ